MNQSQSEFPETAFTKVGRKLGWLFSPILLVTLIIFTLIQAEGVRVNFNKGSFEKKASIEIKEVKEGKVTINDEERGKTPDLFDITTFDSENTVKIIKENKREWSKKVKLDQGFVKTFYPILYPNELDFNKYNSGLFKTYATDESSTFFYEKLNKNKLELYRYSLDRQIFGIKESNILFTDLTEMLSTSEESSKLILKDYKIIPSNNNEKILLIIPNDKVLIIEKGGKSSKLSNIDPKPTDEFLWSPTDSHIVYKSNEEVYSIEISSNKLLVVQKPRNPKEKVLIEFLLDSSLVYKLQDEDHIDLVQNSYEGNELKSIDIPNVSNIRKNNLIKTYNFLEKQNLILLQTSSDIYSYNIITFELKKFNRFKGEEILYIDNAKELVLTINAINPREFRFYDLSRSEIRTFILNRDLKTEPEEITIFNGSNNIILKYPSLLIISDIDGFNQIEITEFKDPEVVLATKYDDNIQITVSDKYSEAKKVEQNPNITPIPSATPIPTTEGTTDTKYLNYDLYTLEFEN